MTLCEQPSQGSEKAWPYLYWGKETKGTTLPVGKGREGETSPSFLVDHLCGWRAT